MARGSGRRPFAPAILLVGLASLVAPGGAAGQAPTRADTLPAAGDQAVEALILSGGGSRGLAHAGVLVGLERLGHEPGIVVGTSMGALVGALYAAGYPPEEIQRRIEEVDWGEIFTPAPLLPGPERVERYPLVSLDWEDDPLRFSRGFIPQWRINRALAHLLFDANARARGDFDRLARRFRAVAADLETGDAVVLANGDLARAVRASMAVPGVFAPVEWQQRYLVDGGIAENLPTSVARALGAGRTVGVDVSRPPVEIQGRKPLQVLSRALDLLQENAQRGTTPPDVLILPEIPPDLHGVTFPGDPTPLFQLGLTAALRDAEGLSASRSPPRALPPAPERLGELILEAPDPALEALARRLLSGVAPGPYEPAAVLAAVDRLYATGLFEAVWPRLEEGSAGSAPSLVVRLEAPPKLSVSGAAGYETDRGGRAWAAVQRSAVLFRWPAMLTAAASADRLDQWGAVSARVFTSPWSGLVWSGGAHLQEVDVRRFEREGLLEDREVQRAGGWLGLELQHALTARAAVAVLRAERVRVEDGERGLSVGPMFRVATQTAEPPIVGTPLEAEAEVRWGSVAYRRVEARGSREVRLRPLRLAAVADLAATSADAPPDVLPALGDRSAMPGYRWGQERAPVRLAAGLDAAYPIPLQGFARARVRVATVADRLEELGGTLPWVTGVEVGVLWSTPFGALSAAWGTNSRGERNVLVSIGPQF